MAKRPDFRIGPLLISPSRRLAEGPGGSATMEPIVLQVLLLLADSRGSVVTRDELFDKVWGGATVGDDSLNRAVAAVRRIVASAAPGLLEIETIPRTGYRLTINEAFAENTAGSAANDSPGVRNRISRRAATVGLAVAAIGTGGIGLYIKRDRDEQEFAALMARAEQILDYSDPAVSPEPYLNLAIAVRPDDARAHGMLAYAKALRAAAREMNGSESSVHEAQRAIEVALEIDPNQSHGRLAEALMQEAVLDMASNEDKLRSILKDDPNNIHAMRHLWNLLHCGGRSRAAFAQVERAMSIKPLAAMNHFPRGQFLWILGRDAEADRVLELAMHYWPRHRFVRFARFILLAFTDRARAALAMLDGNGTAPQSFPPEAVDLWRVSLAALDEPSTRNIEAARAANMSVAQQSLGLARYAVMTLSVLGEIDPAFAAAEALFGVRISRGSEPTQEQPAPPSNSTAWRFAPWLFTPPCAALRADPRFAKLCEEIGLVEYWTTRRVRPDYQLA